MITMEHHESGELKGASLVRGLTFMERSGVNQIIAEFEDETAVLTIDQRLR
jgi:hypothetical protein